MRDSFETRLQSIYEGDEIFKQVWLNIGEVAATDKVGTVTITRGILDCLEPTEEKLHLLYKAYELAGETSGPYDELKNDIFELETHLGYEKAPQVSEEVWDKLYSLTNDEIGEEFRSKFSSRFSNPQLVDGIGRQYNNKSIGVINCNLRYLPDWEERIKRKGEEYHKNPYFGVEMAPKRPHVVSLDKISPYVEFEADCPIEIVPSELPETTKRKSPNFFVTDKGAKQLIAIIKDNLVSLPNS